MKPTIDSPIVLNARNIFQGFLINKYYLRVLNDVSLSISRGEMVAITGISGSGKSTLLNILAGLDSPKQGDVYFKKKNIVNLSESKLAILRNNYMGFIFQQHHLIRELTALENVMLPGMINNRIGGKKVSYEKIKKQAEILLEQVSLKDRKNYLIGELSGGESQRTAIARSLIQNPEIIFADEPTGNLDEINSLETFSLLRSLSRNQYTSIVIVTHSKLLTQKCDQVYVIENKNLRLG